LNTIPRPRILVVSSDAALQERIVNQLTQHYELLVHNTAGRLRNVALAIVAEKDWLSSDAPTMPWPVIIVRAAGTRAPLKADASVRAAFEPAELFERIQTHLELARLRANAAKAEGALVRSLRRQEAEQAMILDTVRAMIWYKDASNRILRCNRAAARWLGKTAEQVQGRSAEELFPPALARAYHENDLAVIASGRAVIGELEVLRTRGRARRWVQRDILPCRDDAGAVAGVVIIAVDVTERKRAEDRLQAQVRKLSRMARARA
jgi:PAS domain S-box-containing protein